MISNVFIGDELIVGQNINTNNITVTNTLTTNNIVVNSVDLSSGTITAQQFVAVPSTQGAGIHVYGDSSYSAEIAFYDGTTSSGYKIWEVGGTTANVTSTSGNFFFVYSNLDSSNALTIETGTPMTINLLGNVYTPNNLTINNTLTVNSIVATSMQLNVTTGNQGLSIVVEDEIYITEQNMFNLYEVNVTTSSSGTTSTGTRTFTVSIPTGIYNPIDFASTAQTAITNASSSQGFGFTYTVTYNAATNQMTYSMTSIPPSGSSYSASISSVATSTNFPEYVTGLPTSYSSLPTTVTPHITNPSNNSTQIFFQSNLNGTLTTHWQLGPAFNTDYQNDFWLFNNLGGYNVLQIHANTPQIDITSSITLIGNININTTLTTLSGPSAGTIYWFQPFQGTAYKKVMVYLVGYENDTTTPTIITFTTAFVTLGSITSNTINGLSTANGTLSLTNTELTINPDNTTVYTGIIVIEGI